MIIRQNKGYEMNPSFPNSDWYNEQNYVVEDGTDLANKIISLYPLYDFVLDANGNLVDVVAIDPPLDTIKKNKKDEIQIASDKAVETFQSSALGTAHTYLADDKSMNYLNAEYNFVRGVDYDQSTTDWYTVEEGFVTHTGDQIAQVFLDGRAYIKEQKTVKLKNLLAQVDAATTKAEVDAIVW